MIYLIVAVTLSYIPRKGNELICESKKSVYIATNGVHLYLILPKEEVRQDIRDKLDLPTEFRFLSFGWGDKEFYTSTPTWADLSVGTAFNALFLNSDAAIHATVYQRPYDDWRKIDVCPEKVAQLNYFIYSYFKAQQGDFIRIYNARGYSHNDFFYEATGSYSFYLTSNEWVNRALKSSGITTSVWSPFDFGVLHHVEKLN